MNNPDYAAGWLEGTARLQRDCNQQGQSQLQDDTATQNGDCFTGHAWMEEDGSGECVNGFGDEDGSGEESGHLQ